MTATYPADPSANFLSSYTEPAAITCKCDDPEAHRVAALVSSGVGLREAALLVYTDDQRARIRQEFRQRFPWLRLPERWAA